MSDEIPDGIRVEPVFLVEARYTEEAAQRRPAVRAEHLTRIVRLIDEGIVVEAGAYGGALSSSILLVRAEDADAALTLARDDVYVRSGVWGTIDVRPFGRVTRA